MNKWVRRFLYFIAGIISLLLVAFLLLQTGWAKNIIRKKIQAYVSTKTNTQFLIGSIDYSLPTWVELNGVLMRDKRKDTLLFGSRIKADVAMLQLLKGKYQVDKILLDNMYVNLVKQETDSVFNYQFIVDAFKSKSEKTISKDTTLIDLSLNELILKQVRFNMLDNQTGSYTRMSVKDFDLRLKNLDLNTMSFDIENLYADELRFQLLLQNKWADTSSTSKSPVIWPSVKADTLLIKNSFISFEDESNKTKTANSIGQLQLIGFNNQANRKTLKGKYLQLINSSIQFDHEIAVKKQVSSLSDTTIKIEELGIIVDDIDLNNNRIIYNNILAPAKTKGLDYGHLAITDLQFNAVKSSYISDALQSTIQRFSFKDKSGFALDSAKGFVKVDSGNIEIKNLYVKTPSSVLQANAMVYPLSFTNNSSVPASLPLNNIIVTNTIISKKDLEMLAESVTAKYKKQINALGDLYINANLLGNARRLVINDLNIRSASGRGFALHTAGAVGNLNDPQNLSYNLNIINLVAPKDFIQPFLINNKQPINLPQVFSVTGLLAGNMNRLQTNINISSAFGKATAKGSVINFKNPAKMQYDLVINAANLETGKWIFKDADLGKITGVIAAKGSNGFDVKKNTIKTTASISSFRLQQNVFHNIKLNALLVNGLATFVASVNDVLLQVNTKGKANIKTAYPSVDAFVNIKKADLFALGFAKDSLQISTLASIDLKNSTPLNLDAFVRLDSTLVITGGKKIFADSALLLAFVRNDSTIINLTSSLADAAVASNLNYQQMPGLLQEVTARYITAPNSAPVPKAPMGTIVASLAIKPNDIYQTFVQDLSFNNAGANFTITNIDKDSAVKGNITAQDMQIGTNKIYNLAATVNGTADSLLLVLNADTIKAGNILLYDALVKAGFADNNLSASVNTKDNKNAEQFALAVIANQNKSTNGYDIKLKDALTLNYKQWSVNDKNWIRTSAQGFNVSDFDISNNQQKISIASTGSLFNAPLQVAIDDFKLSTITAAFNQDSLLLEGLLNADFTASNFKQAIPTIDGTLKLDSIFYQQTSVGNLNLKANSNAGQVNVNGKLDGNGNNVDLSGTYNANNIDVDINLNPLSLLSVQPFTQGNLVRSSGTVSGPISIKGAVSNPSWSGELTLNKVQTTVASFGTYIKADGQKLTLQYPSVLLNNFTVQDSTGNELKINGSVTQNENTDFISDLSLSAKNFTAINNAATDNNMLYGKAIVELDASMKGPIATPELAGNVIVKNGTALTYVQQTTPASIKQREELMEFIDMDTISNLVARNNMPDAPGKKRVTKSAGSLQYNLNLEVEPEAKLSVILDPATRDELQVQGSAQITAAVNPNGTVELAGTYYLVKGSYQLNYGPVEKKFILLSGSSISMSGDPLNATANITAVYDINTAPLDLVGNEVGTSTVAENAVYKRKVPFQVLLKINGTISKPQLSFDIVIKEKSEGISYELSNTIENKLEQLRKDPSAMNKQVFALLALNRFIGDESTDFFGGNGIVNTGLLANASVTGFLNAAVQQLASNLIKGVDIDVNLKNVDDDPSAKRTDLDVTLGKNFLNDRLNISFGKSFTLYGSQDVAKGNAGGNSMQFLPDINTTYKLSTDGRYMLRAYRRNQYEAILDGYFIETGVAFSLTMDYNKFKELLRRKKK